MDIQFTARHFKASEELQEKVRTEIEHLERFYERITKCHVILDAEKKSRMLVEITVGIRGKTLVAKTGSDTMTKAMDGALAKIERQLKKINAIKRERRKDSPSETSADQGDMDEE